MSDSPGKKKRPHDVNQLAKIIVDIATEEAEQSPELAKSAAGRKGGNKGGAARASALSPEQRSDIARLAAQARWKKKD